MTTTETQNKVSAAVKATLDIEHSTVDIDEYKGMPMFTMNKQSRYPFSLGLAKARLILKYIEQLRIFVETEGKSLT